VDVDVLWALLELGERHEAVASFTEARMFHLKEYSPITLDDQRLPTAPVHRLITPGWVPSQAPRRLPGLDSQRSCHDSRTASLVLQQRPAHSPRERPFRC